MKDNQDSNGRNEFKDLNSHLANERTHLSSVRTALSFVGFGITLNRFSIYLLQIDKDRPRGFVMLNEGAYTGLGMVVLGLFMLVWSVYRYRCVLNSIASQVYVPPKITYTLVTSILIGLSIFGVIWMILD